METSVFIPKVIHEIMKDVGYCGSCMGGCDEVTRFICLGKNGTDINKWSEEHKDIVNEWEAEEDRKLDEAMRLAYEQEQG